MKSYSIASILISCFLIDATSAHLVEDFPFYHSTDQIHQELIELSKKCPHLSVNSQKKKTGPGNDVTLDFVSIKGKSSSPKNRVFFLFGEHARELISSESALDLVKTFCGSNPDQQEFAKKALEHSEILITMNANPLSRQRVEKGEYCLRTNEDGVDTNRNWDDHWNGLATNQEEINPGKKPFSEAETQLVKSEIEKFKPTAFLSVHSGTYGMYMPWAYKAEKAHKNQKSMLQILSTLNDSYCKCSFGAAGEKVGYNSYGTCIDYVYEKLEVPYAFAFEIYGKPDENKNEKSKKVTKKKEFLVPDNEAKNEQFKCFGFFNPSTDEEYKSVISNWTSAYLKLVDLVDQRIE
eukprot:GHVL01037981.1.p1 GENE.GHVL01037981.1~~GHVL01037981.1.p1  ORF type:complete len:350 (+),score=50.58 GHVL01037981.1:126-1175(+)